jgi:hypothetical protein
VYSPKISEDLIPILYRLAKELNKPMTELVDLIVRDGLAKYETRDKKLEHSRLTDQTKSAEFRCSICRKAFKSYEGNELEVELKSGRVIFLSVCKKCFEKEH